MPHSFAGRATLTVTEGDQGKQVAEVVSDGWGGGEGRGGEGRGGEERGGEGRKRERGKHSHILGWELNKSVCNALYVILSVIIL